MLARLMRILERLPDLERVMRNGVVRDINYHLEEKISIFMP